MQYKGAEPKMLTKTYKEESNAFMAKSEMKLANSRTLQQSYVIKHKSATIKMVALEITAAANT